MSTIIKFLQKILKVPLFFWGNLVYLIAHIVPKDKNLWIFGAWFGEKYADNSKYLFEYVNKNHPEIRAVWLTRNKNTLEQVRQQGYKAHLAYSLNGMYYTLRAALIIVSSGLQDVNSVLTGGAKKINLWHGSPMKKILLSDNKFKSEAPLKAALRRIYYRLFPWSCDYGVYDVVFAGSNYFKRILCDVFDVPHENVKVLGFPRNDILFDRDAKCLTMEMIISKFKNARVVAYIPTFRDTDDSDNWFVMSGRFGFDEDEAERFLADNNLILLVKAHYQDQKRLKGKLATGETRIIWMGDDVLPDINEALRYFDVLITDYSSVYFDYLLLNRPVVFAAFDLDEYTKSQGLYAEYDFYTAGQIAKNWPDLMGHVLETLRNPKMYHELRVEKNALFNKYRCDGSTRRILEYLRKSFC